MCCSLHAYLLAVSACQSKASLSVKSLLTIAVLCVSSCVSDRSVQVTDVSLEACASISHFMQHQRLKGNAQTVALSNLGEQHCKLASEFHVIKVQM